MENNSRFPLELYIHIPFCVKKCAYCDFLSAPADRETREAYVSALLKEIGGLAGEYDLAEREVVSVFIGGGTPSLLEGARMREIMDCLKEQFDFVSDAEITVEANPGTLDREKLRLYRGAGINRLSLGLQSASNRELRVLGRIHTYEDFLESCRNAREEGFTNINVDLISAVPGQTYEDWIRNLRTVAELGPEHISAYSLIVEPGTLFAQMELDLPDEDTEYRMYEDTAAVLREYGYRQYEISNYAREGFACRHNTGYWKRTEYLGIGLGAASLFEGRRFHNTVDMKEYLADSGLPGAIRKDMEILTRQDEEEEYMFLGLRMTEGVSGTRFAEQFREKMTDVYGEVLDKYEKMGLLQKQGDFWSFTRKGIHVSNGVLADFLQDRG